MAGRDEFALRIHPLADEASRALFEQRASIAGVLVDCDDAKRRETVAPLGRIAAGDRIGHRAPARRCAGAAAARFPGNPSDEQLERPTLTSLLRQAVSALDASQQTDARRDLRVRLSRSARRMRRASFRSRGSMDARPANSASRSSRRVPCSRCRVARRRDALADHRSRARSRDGGRRRGRRAFARRCGARPLVSRSLSPPSTNGSGTVENQQFLENVAPLSIESPNGADQSDQRRAFDDAWHGVVPVRRSLLVRVGAHRRGSRAV